MRDIIIIMVTEKNIVTIDKNKEEKDILFSTLSLL